MTSITLGDVKKHTAQWLMRNDAWFQENKIEIETVINEEESLYVTASFADCMAAIIVEDPDFAPYRFISFQAVALVESTPKLIYSWYDDNEITLNEITLELQNAVEFCYSFKSY